MGEAVVVPWVHRAGVGAEWRPLAAVVVVVGEVVVAGGVGRPPVAGGSFATDVPLCQRPTSLAANRSGAMASSIGYRPLWELTCSRQTGTSWASCSKTCIEPCSRRRRPCRTRTARWAGSASLGGPRRTRVLLGRKAVSVHAGLGDTFPEAEVLAPLDGPGQPVASEADRRSPQAHGPRRAAAAAFAHGRGGGPRRRRWSAPHGPGACRLPRISSCPGR